MVHQAVHHLLAVPPPAVRRQARPAGLRLAAPLQAQKVDRHPLPLRKLSFCAYRSTFPRLTDLPALVADLRRARAFLPHTVVVVTTQVVLLYPMRLVVVQASASYPSLSSLSQRSLSGLIPGTTAPTATRSIKHTITSTPQPVRTCLSQ